MAKKGTGLSREPRIREKQLKTLEVYAEHVADIGGDPARDRQAQIAAVERGGYTRATTDSAKVNQFLKLWKSDEARAYLAELWGLAVTEQPDPVSLAFQMLNEHMTQPVEECRACNGQGIKEATVRGDETFIACPACEGTGKRSEWGPRERGVSLSAAREVVRIFVPQQTTKIASMHVSAKIERPAEFSEEPVMLARTILPAGQTISKPTGPVGSEDDDEDDLNDDE